MEIKKVIKAKGFTLIEVAGKMGISKGGISQIVNGSNPNIKTLRAIAEIIGCKVGDFFEDETTKAEPANSYKCPHCGKEIHVSITG